MVKRMACVLFAVAMVMTMRIQANAAEESGSIQISLDAGEMPVTNGAVMLYQVGTKVTDGYRIVEGFGGGIVKEEDATSPHLARWLTEMAGESGKRLLLDVDGRATFSNLEEGLYLIVQTEKVDGFYPFRSFLVTLPREGEWQVQMSPDIEPIVRENIMEESPKTGQHPAPLLGAMGLVLSGMGLIMCIEKIRKK